MRKTTSTRFARWTASVLVVLGLLAVAFGSIGATPAAAASDTTAPAAPTVSPTDGSTGFPVNGFVELTFGEDMDAGTLTNDKVQIRLGGVDGAVVSAETVVLASDLKKVYVYPDRMLDISQGYTVWVSGSVTDLAGNPMGTDFTSTFTTAATGVTPHGNYSESSNLCRNCHAVHGATGPKLFWEATEKQVCYTCHDGTGSSYNVKTSDSTTPFTWDFGEATVGSTSKVSYHPVPVATNLGTSVTMLCSNCHNAHSMTGTGVRFLAPKKLDPSYTGTYGPQTGNQFCFTCHNTDAAASAGYISTASWNASTGFDHKTYFPTTDTGHNRTTAVLGVNMVNPTVPQKEGVACKGCHSEHGTSNDKLIAETVNGLPATFDATTNAQINATYNNFCRNCHSVANLGGNLWPGNPDAGTSYINSGHATSTKTRDITYPVPAPAGTVQTILVGVCKQCHEPHGTANANYVKAAQEDLCYQCHGDAGPASLVGPGTVSYSIQRKFTVKPAPVDNVLAYRTTLATPDPAVPLTHHPVASTDQNLNLLVDYYDNTTLKTTATRRATGVIECVNCHNPHLNGSAAPPSLYWHVLDSNVQPGQAGYPTALRTYKTTNALGGVSYGNTSSDYNPDHPLGLHSTQPHNPGDNTAESTPDSIQFCLACHDGSIPAGTSPAVSMGGGNGGIGPLNIMTRWLHATATSASYHGRGAGNVLSEPDIYLKYPYRAAANSTPGSWTDANTAQPYAALQCTTCHDPHGSQNVYLLREYIVVDGVVMNDRNEYLNGTATGAANNGSGDPFNYPTWPSNATSTNIDNFYRAFCGNCHSRYGKFNGHYSASCDGQHRWISRQAPPAGLHDNTITGTDEMRW